MQHLKLRVEIEKGVEALLELGLNLLARSLQHVHGDVGLVPVGQLQRSIVNLRHFALRQQPHSVDQSQIRHVRHLYIGLLGCAVLHNGGPGGSGCWGIGSVYNRERET